MKGSWNLATDRDSADENDEKLYMDGFDKAIIGYGNQYPKDEVVIYSKRMIIDILVDGGMDIDDAVEYYEFNIACAYLGDGTPIICDDMYPGREEEDSGEDPDA